MRKELQDKIKELSEKATEIWKQGKEADLNDPVIKLLLLAVASETLEIKEQIGRSNEEIAALFRDDVLPYNLVQARPAFSILQLSLNDKIIKTIKVDDTFDFTYEKKSEKEKATCNFKPLLETNIIPAEVKCMFKRRNLYVNNKKQFEAIGKTNQPVENTIWVGLKISQAVETLSNTCFQLDHMDGHGQILPPNIKLTVNGRELPVIHAYELENLKRCSIFESPFPNDFLFGDIDHLRELFLECPERIYYTGNYGKKEAPLTTARYPDEFKKHFPAKTLEKLTEELVWLKIEIESYNPVDTENIDFRINCVPVVNVDTEQLVLDVMNPIMKLQKSVTKQFMNLLFDKTWEQYKPAYPVIVRDMDMERFNPSDLQKQIQYLFNRFTSDFYAFKNAKNLRDGIKLNNARKAINDLYVSCIEDNIPEYTGYYALLNLKIWKDNEPVMLKYLCCDGASANGILKEETAIVVNPSFNRQAVFTAVSYGGKNKAREEDKKYIARYQILANDKLVSNEDIRVFCYKELGIKLKTVDVRPGTIAADNGLCRGIIITLKLKEKIIDKQRDYYNFTAKQLEKKITLRSASIFPMEVRIV